MTSKDETVMHVQQYQCKCGRVVSIPIVTEQAADQYPNAPWLSEAHMLCSDQGIPPGHITTRIQALRNKLAAAAPEAR